MERPIPSNPIFAGSCNPFVRFSDQEDPEGITSGVIASPAAGFTSSTGAIPGVAPGAFVVACFHRSTAAGMFGESEYPGVGVGRESGGGAGRLALIASSGVVPSDAFISLSGLTYLSYHVLISP
jgi:hypothetical protein